ncbi:MAG: methyltransferase domain-containing protein [Bacteroidetes bacterium]|nr:methyltransferase domain-containing protein [Bacteroidota bacterium]
MKDFIKATFGLQNSKAGLGNDTARVDWIISKLKELPKGSRLLDAGAGEMRFRKYCEHLIYIAQDFAQYDPSKIDMGLQMEKWDYTGLDIVCDIINIPEPNGSFDNIMCIEVIEHIPDPAKVFPEFSRLLKPGGKLILTAPFCSLTHFAPYHYSTGFSRFYYEKHLADHGFEIIELVENGNYFEYLAQELRRLPEVLQKYTGKQPGTKERAATTYLLNMMEEASAHDKGSKELLCYGIQVLARKK